MTEDLSTGFDGITWPDYIVIALYFIFVLAVGLFVSMQIFLKQKWLPL
jgi:hypothetical protein